MSNDHNPTKPTSHVPKDMSDLSDAAALLVPAMPPPATLRLLIPESCKWIARSVTGGVLIDITVTVSITDHLRTRHGGVR